MARKKSSDPRIRKIFSLPESLVAKLELYCKDPVTGRAHKDDKSQSKLVERLLREYFAKLSVGPETQEED